MRVTFSARIRWLNNEKYLLDSNVTLRSAYVNLTDVIRVDYEDLRTMITMDKDLAVKKGLVNDG